MPLCPRRPAGPFTRPATKPLPVAEHIPESADDFWLSPWLNWLDAVETTSGRREFADHVLDELHALFKLGRTAADGVAYLKAQS